MENICSRGLIRAVTAAVVSPHEPCFDRRNAKAVSLCTRRGVGQEALRTSFRRSNAAGILRRGCSCTMCMRRASIDPKVLMHVPQR